MPDGLLKQHPDDATRQVADLPSPRVQAHAANLMVLGDSSLACVWFGGSMEGRSDISVFMSRLDPGAAQWSEPIQLSHDAERSEQNPVLFPAPGGELWLLHTAQYSGHQNTSVVRRRLSLEEWQAIHEHAKQHLPPWVSRMLVLALVTGQRRGDLQKMRFADAYDDHLHIQQQKTGTLLRLPLALRLDYRRSIAGAAIAEASVKEMRRFGGEETVLAAWHERMARIFPDVQDGDHILGVYTPDGARFSHNGRDLGGIDDARFARDFFGIWLDPRTSAPELRAALLTPPAG